MFRVSRKTNWRNLSNFIISRLFEDNNTLEFTSLGEACDNLFSACRDVIGTVPNVNVELKMDVIEQRSDGKNVPRLYARIERKRNS